MKFSREDFESLKNQDVRILEAMFNMYAKKIYNFLLIKTKGNHDCAGELLNDTFLSAFESAPTLKSAKNIQSWLLKIAHRRFFDDFIDQYDEKYSATYGKYRTDRITEVVEE